MPGISLAPFLLAPFVWSSQSSPPDLFPELDQRAIAWPANLTGLSRGKLVVGDFTGDLQADAVILNGTTPVVLYAPAVHETLFALPQSAEDLACLPASVPGQGDTLAMVGPSGLVLASDYQAGAFTYRAVGSAAWNGATHLRAADLDHDGTVDLAAIASGQQSLLVLLDPEGASPLESSIALGATALDMVPIDWAGNGSDLRLAVVKPTGLEVRTLAGGIDSTLAFSATAAYLAPLRQSDVSFERLAICFLYGGNFLTVVDSSGPETPLSLGLSSVFATAAGDADGDGYDDLYLVHRASHDTVLFLNQAGQPSSSTTFAFGAGEAVNVEAVLSPTSTWKARPTLSDLTGDGDPDALVFVEASDRFVLAENRLVAHGDLEVEVVGGVYVFDEVQLQAQLRLDVDVPTQAFTATHVEVVGWKESHAPGSPVTVDPSAAVHRYVPVSGGPVTVLPLDLDETDLDTDNVYYFEMRAVALSGATVVAAGPTSVSAFSTPASLVGQLEQSYGPGIGLRVFVIQDESGEEIEVGPAELADRLLAPKEVPTEEVPPIDAPPNPFD